MKEIIFVFLCFSAITIGNLEAQNLGRTLPDVTVKSLNRQTVQTSSFTNNGKPVILAFWATWCKPCILELNTISEEYESWVKETGVKLIAISTDDARTAAKVAPFVSSQDWQYEVYQDENGDFRRALSVTDMPCILLNGKGEIVWIDQAYSPGDEEELHELLIKLSESGTIGD